MTALLKGVKDKKSRALVLASEEKFDRAVEARDKSELLLTESAGLLEAEGMERTFRFPQEAIRAAVDVAAARTAFALDLPTYGPYKCAYSRNGRCVCVAGWCGVVRGGARRVEGVCPLTCVGLCQSGQRAAGSGQWWVRGVLLLHG